MGTSAIGEMNIVLSANAASFSSQIDQAQRKLDQLAGRSRSASHTMVSDLQATSGGLRLLEGGMTNSLRAAERFLSTLPGVGAAMKAAFPVVGAIAFGAILLRLGEEIYKFVDQAKHLPDQIGDGFNQLALSGRTANDELEKTNVNLENEIAKLEGRPQNNLAETLIDARIAADKLAEALQGDADKMEQLLAKSHVSILAGLVHGNAPTAATEASINDWNEAIKELGYQREEAMHQGDQARAAEMLREIDGKRQQALAWARNSLQQQTATQTPEQAGSFWFSTQPGARVSGPGGVGANPVANIKELEGFQQILEEQGDSEQEEAQNAKDAAREKQLQAAKDFSAAQKQLAEKTLRQWRQQLDDLKAAEDMTLAQEAQFWVQRAEFQKAGSLTYLGAMDEANKAIAAMRAENMRAMAEPNGIGGRVQSPELEVSDRPVLEEQSRQAAQFLETLNQGIALRRESASALAEASLKMQVATGQMGKLDAAEVQAALHTQEYSSALERLREAYGAIAAQQGAGALTPIEARQRTSALDNQRTQMDSDRALQVMQDQQAIQQQTIGGATREALDEMVSTWKDMADAIAKTLTQTVGGFNEDIAGLLMQRHVYRGDIGRAFGGTVREAGGSLIRSGLQTAEAGILGRFGFGGGKRDGSTEQQALWVQIAGGAAGQRSSSAALPAAALSESRMPAMPANFLGWTPPSTPSLSAEALPTTFPESLAPAMPSNFLGWTPPSAPTLSAAALPSTLSESRMPAMPNNFLGWTPPSTPSLSAEALLPTLPGGPAATLPSSFLGLTGAGGSDDSDVSSVPDANSGPSAVTIVQKPRQSNIGNIVSSLTGRFFQGFFADGGDVIADRPSIVGELGPELFVPRSAGTIVPNGSFGGNTQNHTWNIDARGSNDPAAVEAAVNRAMRGAMPQAVAASVAATRDRQMRNPSSSR